MGANCAGYLDDVLSSPQNTAICVEAAVTKIKACIKPEDYDCIAFRGVSGAVVAPVVAYQLGKGLIPVRKGENAHSTNSIEVGNHDYKRYLIVDDFIDSGDTVVAIEKACRGYGMTCVGIVTYKGYTSRIRKPWHPRYDSHPHRYDKQPQGEPELNKFWLDYYKSVPIYSCR
jgi:orotate phosphoribosyltransferase